MSQFLTFISIFLASFGLLSCSTGSYNKFNRNLGQEVWMHMVEDSPMQWTRGSDEWFTSGDDQVDQVPTFEPKVGQFSNITANGDFTVQIYGTLGENSVRVYGPAQGVASVAVKTKGNMLILEQKKKASPFARQVVIRIGVRQLNCLVQKGRGLLEAVRLNSDPLTVTSTSSGNVFVAGHLNPVLIQNFGGSNMNIFGVYAPEVVIRTNGSGSTNISGNVGVNTIKHYGSGNIAVVGANTNHLNIYATGSGKISVNGIVRLNEVIARSTTAVFVLGVITSSLHIAAYGYSRVGVSGCVYNLNLDAFQNSYVGARNLCADEVYVRTANNAHANVSAMRKAFTQASGNSSIYFFGREEVLTRFSSDRGFILRMCAAVGGCPMIPAEPVMLRGAG